MYQLLSNWPLKPGWKATTTTFPLQVPWEKPKVNLTLSALFWRIYEQMGVSTREISIFFLQIILLFTEIGISKTVFKVT